jgi:monomeric sarcosine oxidase
MTTYDFAVIGAGVFGAWTARQLQRSGASVILIDAYGPANSRSSSGGETRVIRMGYGPDDLYTRWAIGSLPAWRQLESETGVQMFHQSGVLWLSEDSDAYTLNMLDVLKQYGVACERLDQDEIRNRYPELYFDQVSWGVLEQESGLLMARRSVQTLVEQLKREGVDYRHATVGPVQQTQKLTELKTAEGYKISAGTFVFACGPWLPKLFPDVLTGRIFLSRQEIFFLGPPPGSNNFEPSRMPVWLYHQHPYIPYSLPDIEGRGFKLAFDLHGEAIDPDLDQRVVSEASILRLRSFVAKHIPSLAHAPIVETRVCQYENTWNGDFLIDRHPQAENVWMVGGGSGHGFKHGPAVGEYVMNQILGKEAAEPRFSLQSKQAQQKRAVY